MRFSKSEFFALIVLLFVGFYFYNQYQLQSDSAMESAVAPILMDENHTPVIVAFGDSLTAGVGAPPDKSYPAQLSEMLGIDVINEGRSHEPSREAVGRIDLVLKRYHPDIVLIETGFDDMLTGRKRSYIRENLTKIVAKVKKSGATPIIIGVPDLDLVGLMISSDVGLYEEVAQKTGALYIPDVFGPVLRNESLTTDENYPNAEGYRKAAETINEFLTDIM